MYRQTVRLTSHFTEVYDLPGCSEALLRSVTQIPRNRFWDRGISNRNWLTQKGSSAGKQIPKISLLNSLIPNGGFSGHETFTMGQIQPFQ